MTHVCPTCEEEFETNSAMHAHHKSTHGEKLPVERLESTDCIGCEQEFTYDPERRESNVCYQCGKQYPGVHNSPTIKDVLKNMDPETLRENHD